MLVLKPGQSVTAQEIRAHCAAHLAPYEVPEYVVFAQALPTNAAGKTLKPPLVDEWGEGETAADVASRLRAYCASMPDALLDKPQFKLDGSALTPREALAAVGADNDLGRRIIGRVGDGGVVALTKPDEARFR